MTPRLAFHGAARCVTGSCYRLETEGGALLVDCGLFQGSKTEKELNYRPFPFRPRDVAAVILTHAHIDHSGLLPKLVREGFGGAIHATAATADLAGVMLPDSAHIQRFEVEQLNRRRAHRRRAPVTAIYAEADVRACLGMFRRERYGRWFAPLPGVRARFWNAGHLLGSASVELEIAGAGRDGGALRLLFSGDIGPDHKLLHPDPEGPEGLDHVICEATYGDRDRADATPASRREALAEEVRAAMRPNGALLIPSFAVERAQELVSDLMQLMSEGALPPIPVYVDSPMATKATRVFARHAKALDGGDALLAGLKSKNLHFTETAARSMALDRLHDFHIVIAASGMCEAGRIRHRLKNWLWRDEATVLMTGYQAAGTLGRILLDGAESVRIQGEAFAVRARIRSIELYSGHADARGLAAWVSERRPIAGNLFLVHGEPPAIEALRGRLDGVVDRARVLAPTLDSRFDLTPDAALPVAAPAPRIAPEKVATLDWHNDVSRLLLDINETLGAAADERARDAMIRRLRRALEAEERG